MLNRRLIRIKVFQVLYAYLQDETPSLNKAKSYLENSITGIEHNFFTVILFPIELIHYMRTNLNPKENKYLPSAEDQRAFDNMSFDGLYERIVQNEEVAKYLAKPKHRWQDHPDVLRKVYHKMRQAKSLNGFMTNENPTEDERIQAIRDIYNYLINESEEFNQEMEEIEMLWEDEKSSIKKAVDGYMKSLLRNKSANRARNGNGESDLEFAESLLEKSVRSGKDFEEMIGRSAAKWDADRIAKTDMVIMTMALTELVHFPYIPVKVSLNEYLELAKEYSTPQSSKFVNGVLDKLVKELKAENRLVKKGRGMVG